MIDFTLHTEKTAPAESRPLLDGVKGQLGFVPNLFRVLAESPAAAEGYLTLSRLFDASTLTPAERHVVLQTINLTNECHYCVPAHSTLAKGAGLEEVDRVLRAAAPLTNERLAALRKFTRAVVEQRGRVSEAVVSAFLSAGYDKRQLFDVIVGVGLKSISNTTNHIAKTPVDAVFGEGAP